MCERRYDIRGPTFCKCAGVLKEQLNVSQTSALADKKEVDPLRQENFDRPSYLNSVTPADTDRCVDCAAAAVQPRLTTRHHGGIAMPEPWDQKRVALLTGMLLETGINN